MRQRLWRKLFSDYDYEIRYHPGKAKVVADALGLDEIIEQKSDGNLYYLDQIWVPLKGEVRTLIMDEAHKSKYFVHQWADKMYYDLRDRYWWPEIKKDIVEYVITCSTCLKVKAEHQRPSDLLQQPEIPIKDRLKATRDSQKSYADKMRKPLEFSVAGSESRPPMLNKENYVPWSSRLLRYAKSRPNGKLIYNSIINGPYVRRMIPEPGDTNREVPVNETFHVQTDDELTEKELKQIKSDDQAIQTILLGLSEDIYAAVDSCETA
nr:hypothetical protein [Tanacetum cinerariifolium]